MTPPNNDSWVEWSKHVLLELRRLDENCVKLQGKLDNISYELVTLKTKATIWGAIAGAIFSVIGSKLIK
jgi:hypothetical protein